MNEGIKIFYTEDWNDYELLDTGAGEKLERFGQYVLARPYEDAAWPKTLTEEWENVDGRFITSKEGGKSGWKLNARVPLKWTMDYKGIKFHAFPTPFRHLGFFPEQAGHWDFIEGKIKSSGRKIKFLNLFGYTGVASLFALRAGAEVTHLDASRTSLDAAKENQMLNPDLKAAPMRVILDDALKFLEREEKRGNKYDAVIMDPPKFGRGPKGEVWKIEEKMTKLLASVRKVLSPEPLFVILTSYAVDSSSLSLGYSLSGALEGLKGAVEQGELCLKETAKERFIPLANTAVWQS